MEGTLLELKEVTKRRDGLVILKEVSMTLNRGGMALVVGRSGSGKTTLCKVAGLIERFDAGQVLLDGANTRSERESQRLRLHEIGYVPQFNDLLETLSLRENILLPALEKGSDPRETGARAESVARKLGIADLLDRFPADVSGGEAQRAAIVRAVVKDPKLIVADEPTSSLDDESRDRAFGLFQELVQSGRTGVLATLTASDSGYLRGLDSSNVYSIENGQVTRASV